MNQTRHQHEELIKANPVFKKSAVLTAYREQEFYNRLIFSLFSPLFFLYSLILYTTLHLIKPMGVFYPLHVTIIVGFAAISVYNGVKAYHQADLNLGISTTRLIFPTPFHTLPISTKYIFWLIGSAISIAILGMFFVYLTPTASTPSWLLAVSMIFTIFSGLLTSRIQTKASQKKIDKALLRRLTARIQRLLHG